jgi:hypothetical protein
MEGIPKNIMTIQNIMLHLWNFKHAKMQFKRMSIHLGDSFDYFLPIGKSRCDVSSGTTQGWVYTKLLVKLIYSLNITTNITMDEIHSWMFTFHM